MWKVTYKDGKDNNTQKVKFFKTKIEAIGFEIVSWHEYQCYDFKREEVKENS